MMIIMNNEELLQMNDEHLNILNILVIDTSVILFLGVVNLWILN